MMLSSRMSFIVISVAATGLPEPQKDHAVRMVRFATDCILKMNSLVTELSVSLGADTAALQLRVGIHSGSVTGGVLKGAKSRFQLFGDSMNVASRMESLGKAGKIQVSKATADLIAAAGKEKWLVPREDTVIAKGKGEIQCFWVVIPSSMASTDTGSCLTNDIDSSDIAV